MLADAEPYMVASVVSRMGRERLRYRTDMEWRTNKDGDTRERLKFAWLPMRCEDGITRWLCNVRVVEEYGYWGYDPLCPHSGWNIKKVYRAEVEIQRRRAAR